MRWLLWCNLAKLELLSTRITQAAHLRWEYGHHSEAGHALPSGGQVVGTALTARLGGLNTGCSYHVGWCNQVGACLEVQQA